MHQALIQNYSIPQHAKPSQKLRIGVSKAASCPLTHSFWACQMLLFGIQDAISCTQTIQQCNVKGCLWHILTLSPTPPPHFFQHIGDRQKSIRGIRNRHSNDTFFTLAQQIPGMPECTEEQTEDCRLTCQI